MSVASVAYDSAAVIPNGTAAARFLFYFHLYFAQERACVLLFSFFPQSDGKKKIKFFLKSDLHFRGVSCLYKWGTKYETQNEKECDENVRT